LQVCLKALQVCLKALQVCLKALQVCLKALQVCLKALQVCFKALQVCSEALQVCGRERLRRTLCRFAVTLGRRSNAALPLFDWAKMSDCRDILATPKSLLATKF
jgi:hypothetical protein